MSKAQGLIHARTALLDDNSYDWDDQTTGDCQPIILYAVPLSREGASRSTLAFDFGCPQLWIVETQRHVDARAEDRRAAGSRSCTRQMASLPPESP